MSNQMAKAQAFLELHNRAGIFSIPNPWDVGSARLLEHLGFEALATTSLGVANMHGRRRTNADHILENIRSISATSSLPLNADLEDGFAAEPEQAAKMIIRAAECGAVGGSIEDAIGGSDGEIYDFNLSVERIHAAVEAAHALPFPFLLTARAEALLYGSNDLDDIIRRLQAFEAAGADVLYAPGLTTLSEIRQVTAAIKKPFNHVMGFADSTITQKQLYEAGVKRVSIGGGLNRVALQAFMIAAKEMRNGRFTFIQHMIPVRELHSVFSE